MPEQIPALSFGQAAAHYDRIRPSYPIEAIRWALGGHPLLVVDLGAGTGILTRMLIEAGHDVVPVEPDEGMRTQLADATPGTTALAGSAEAIPLPDGSVDGVVAGQAYHWFYAERAHPEIARVLRPGGIFAALWNVRDESVPWVAELTRVASLRDGTSHLERPVNDFGPAFRPLEKRTFRHSTTHTADTLVDLVKSRSYYLTATPTRRAEIESAVRHLAATHPDLAGRETFELPYLTEVYRTVTKSPDSPTAAPGR